MHTITSTGQCCSPVVNTATNTHCVCMHTLHPRSMAPSSTCHPPCRSRHQDSTHHQCLDCGGDLYFLEGVAARQQHPQLHLGRQRLGAAEPAWAVQHNRSSTAGAHDKNQARNTTLLRQYPDPSIPMSLMTPHSSQPQSGSPMTPFAASHLRCMHTQSTTAGWICAHVPARGNSPARCGTRTPPWHPAPH